MNESLSLVELLPEHARDPEILEDIEAFAPELAALRDARKRAFDGRVAAENALREAESAEADLRAREEQALAAVAARREQLAEAARRREQEARERVAQLELRFHQAAVAIEEAQLASHAAERERDEAQRALERLGVSCVELQERLRGLKADRQRLENELSAARLEAAAPHVRTPVRAAAAVDAISPEPPESAESNVAVLTDRIDLLQQRAAERRAADALRARTG